MTIVRVTESYIICSIVINIVNLQSPQWKSFLYNFVSAMWRSHVFCILLMTEFENCISASATTGFINKFQLIFCTYFCCTHVKVRVRKSWNRRMFQLSRIRDIGFFYKIVLVKAQRKYNSSSSGCKFAWEPSKFERN